MSKAKTRDLESGRGDRERLNVVDNANCFSRWLMWWLKPLLVAGRERGLDVGDLFDLPAKEQSSNISSIFQTEWERQLKSGSSNLLWVLLRSFGIPLIASGVCRFVHDVLIFVGPYLLFETIAFLIEPVRDIHYGFSLATGFYLNFFFVSICLRHFYLINYVVGLRFRGAAVAAMMKKSLRLSLSNFSKNQLQDMVNLINNEAQKIQDIPFLIHYLWSNVLQVIFCLAYLFVDMGIAAFAGVLIVLFSIPVHHCAVYRMNLAAAELNSVRSQRIKLTREVFTSIKLIKMEGWEAQYIEKLSELRKKESRLLQVYTSWKIFESIMWNCTPMFVGVSANSTFAAIGRQFAIPPTLVAVSLFDLLRGPMASYPEVVIKYQSALEALHKIRDFLLFEEFEPIMRLSQEIGVEMTDLTCVWLTPYDPAFNKIAKKAHEKDKPIYLSHPGALRDLARSDPLKLAGFEIIALRDQVRLNRMEMARLHNELALARGETPSNLYRTENGLEESGLTELRNSAQGALQVQSVKKGLFGALLPESVSAKVAKADYSNMDEVHDDEEVVDFIPSLTPVTRVLAISDISLKVVRGELLMIAGASGSGKSTVLAGILGEAKRIQGSVSKRGTVSYLPQRPYIVNGTIKENITGFSEKPYDSERYKLAVKVTGLDVAIRNFSSSDSTVLGTYGVTVSDDLRGRVGLARCIYQDADIYLLDDPLANVDSASAAALFQHAILKALANKCVVMTTSSALILSNEPRISRVLTLEKGRVREYGQFKNLINHQDTLLYQMVTAARLQTHAGASAAPKSTATNDFFDDGPRSDSVDMSEVDLGTGNKSLGANVPAAELGNVNAAIPQKDDSSFDKGTITKAHHIMFEGGKYMFIFLVFALICQEAFGFMGRLQLTLWSVNGYKLDLYIKFMALYWFYNFIAASFTAIRVSVAHSQGGKATKKLGEEMIKVVARAPMFFFDTNPIRDIIARFSADLMVLDEQLIDTFCNYLGAVFRLFILWVTIAVASPWFLIFWIPSIYVYVSTHKLFTRSYREIARLDATTRAELNNFYTDILGGLSTIRAFDAQGLIEDKIYEAVDRNQKATYLSIASNTWMCIRMEAIQVLAMGTACILAVIQVDRSGFQWAGLVGIGLNLLLTSHHTLHGSIVTASDLEAQLLALERVDEFSRITPEDDDPDAGEHQIPHGWPHQGSINFRNVKLRAGTNLPMHLNNFSLDIRGRSKVGIVCENANTRSMVTTALLRLSNPESGSILVDDVDIFRIGVRKLRSSISVIPSNPVMLAGYVKDNLDPLRAFPESQLAETLKRVGATITLDQYVNSGGVNISVGQRQLIAIARAILNKGRVIIYEETAISLDDETDFLIKKAMREFFADCTVLTIANHATRVLDQDLVVVIKDGKVEEFDAPGNLKNKQTGEFRRMLEQAQR